MLTQEQLARYQHKRLCAVDAQYLTMNAQQILVFTQHTLIQSSESHASFVSDAAMAINASAPIPSGAGDALSPRILSDIQVLAGNSMRIKLCHYWVYLTWIKEIGYDNPKFWHAVVMVEQLDSPADQQQPAPQDEKTNPPELDNQKRTRIRTGIHIVSCLLGDIDIFRALLRCVNLPVRSLQDIPLQYIHIENLKELAVKLQNEHPTKMIHSAAMKQLMGWSVNKRKREEVEDRISSRPVVTIAPNVVPAPSVSSETAVPSPERPRLRSQTNKGTAVIADYRETPVRLVKKQRMTQVRGELDNRSSGSSPDAVQIIPMPDNNMKRQGADAEAAREVSTSGDNTDDSESPQHLSIADSDKQTLGLEGEMNRLLATGNDEQSRDLTDSSTDNEMNEDTTEYCLRFRDEQCQELGSILIKLITTLTNQKENESKLNDTIESTLVECDWLSAEQLDDVKSLLNTHTITESAQPLSTLLSVIHAPLILKSIEEQPTRLMSTLNLLFLLLQRFGRLYVQSVRQHDIAALADAMSYHVSDDSLMYEFLRYMRCLTSFGQCHEHILDWVEVAWPPLPLLTIMEGHIDERDIVLESLRLVSVYAESQRRKGQELIAVLSYEDELLKTARRHYPMDIEIRNLLEEIIRPMDRWLNFRRPVTQPALIVHDISHALLGIVDVYGLKVRQRAEQVHRSQINTNNTDYFSPSVRGIMAPRMLEICGRREYTRDTAHHAIYIMDVHFSNQTESIDATSDDCQRSMVACLVLAVRLQANLDGEFGAPSIFQQDGSEQSKSTLEDIEKTAWPIFLKWDLLLLATPLFWLHQLIYRTLSILDEDQQSLTRALLDAEAFARAGQYVDMMMVFTSQLPYRLIAAVAFCIVYQAFCEVLGAKMTEITGYSVDEVRGVAEAIAIASKAIRPYRLQVDSDLFRSESNNTGEYVIDFMRQPVYDMQAHLLQYDSTIFIPAKSWCERPTVQVPAKLHKWRLMQQSKLGAGAYGTVHRAKCLITGQLYACKMLRSAMNSTLLREIAILRCAKDFKLRHVLTLTHVEGNINDKQKRLRIYLPLCEQTLKESSESRLTAAQIRSFLKQLLTGVHDLHAAGIVHRDLKPNNILIRRRAGESDEELFIADFGLSRVVSRVDHLLTGDIATLRYTAPEVLFQYHKYTFAFDMWSAGCTFAEMITGKPLFKQNSCQALRLEICRKLGTPPLDQMFCARHFIRQSRMPADPKSYLRELCKALPHEDQENAADLLHSLLQVDFTKRISASKALEHPYFMVHKAPSATPPLIDTTTQQPSAMESRAGVSLPAINEQGNGSASVVLISSSVARKEFSRKRALAAKEMGMCGRNAPRQRSLKCTSQPVAEQNMQHLAEQVRQNLLQPKQYLSDVHIDFIMAMLNYHSCYVNNRHRHAFCFSTSVVGRHNPEPFDEYKIVHPSQPTVGSLTARFRLFPVNIRNIHWILAIHDQQTGVLYVLDSLCWEDGKDVLSLAHLLGVRQPIVSLLNTPLQSNGYDCGCWVIEFAIAVVNAESWTPRPGDPTLFTTLKVEGARDRLLGLATGSNWKKPAL